ncbi:MAG: ATP synthase F1 subunit epsilon [Spirochaetae bacterium HGW-Spirochaetae-1]|jgi:F-type H+-transporting ATPase subunit epsilon|nr:MAG: ATP synthase F1 subunit epsilon [Spirochaetae bacterium HGW-Spirochaetae-1]
MNRKINCSILTPEKTLYEGDIDFVVVQAYDGELGFLYGHAPLIAELGIGEVRLRDHNSTDYLVIEGGIVEIKDNRLIVLAEAAISKKELKKDELEKKMKELEEQKSQLGKFSEEQTLIKLEQDKVKARLRVALR